MAVSKVDAANQIENTLPIAQGGTGMTSGFKNGITVADQWRLTANVTADTDPISSNLEQIDGTAQGTLGSAMTVSSGRFAFPQTGIYLVRFNAYTVQDSNGDNILVGITATTDNSTYTEIARAYAGGSNSAHNSVSVESLIDVTDTSLVKVSFKLTSVDSGSQIRGNSSANHSYMTFLRLGDT